MNGWLEFLLDPWVTYPNTYGQILLMGFLVNIACGWIGFFLILRRFALLGDALSHSILPGVVAVFLIGAGASTFLLFGGAVLAGFTAVAAMTWLQRWFPIQQGAAMATVFSLWFAFGIFLISSAGSRIDLDLDCILFGEISAVGLLPPDPVLGLGILPFEVARMATVFLILASFLTIFHKELVLSTFDPELAHLTGLRPRVIQASLLILLTLTLVSALESVGIILPVGMLIFPGATALLLCHRIRYILPLIGLLSLISAVGGFYLALAIDSAVAPSMLLVNALCFVLAWSRHLFRRWRPRPRPVSV